MMGVETGDLVGLCLERSLDLVIAVYAVMKAGAGNNIFNVDGTETVGTAATPATSAGTPRFDLSNTSTTLQEAEAGWLDNVYASQAQRTAICKNQASEYGTTGGTFCQ